MTDTQTETTYSIAQFIADYGVTMEATPVPANPNMSDMAKGSAHFHCVIKSKDGRVMVTYFSVGSGIVEHWMRTAKIPGWPPKPHRMDQIRGKVAEAVYFDAHRDKYRPDLASVLDCLASDTSGIENARDFDDWASDYGYDTDSRNAEQTYTACRQNARELLAMLGKSAFETLLWNTERE